LSDVIVGLGFADRETVDQALDGSRAPGKKLGTTLVEMGALSEGQLGRAVAERYRLDFLALSEFDIDPEAVQVIGNVEMRRYDAVPVAFTEDGALVVAMVDPADWLAAEEMAQLTGRRIRRAVAAPSEIVELISRVAEAKSEDDGRGGHDSADETSSTMQSRLTLRPVTRPLAGRALGREFGIERPPPASAAPEERPQIPTQAPAERAATDRVAAQAAAGDLERRLIPVPSRTAKVEAAPDQQKVVEAPTEGLDAARANDVDHQQVRSALDHPSEDPAPAERERTAPSPVPDEPGGEDVPDYPVGEDAAEEQPGGEHAAEQPGGEHAADEQPSGEHAANELRPDAQTPADEAQPILSFALATEESERALQEATLAPAEVACVPIAAPDAEPAAEQPQAESGDTRGDSEELKQARAELAGARADLDETNAALERMRDELEGARAELVATGSRHDGVLERSAETERLLAESQAQVGRLEADLAAAQEQSRSLREDLSWARGQIEQQGQREGEALAELRSHIESMKGLRPVDPPPPAAPPVSSTAESAQALVPPPTLEPPAAPAAPRQIAAPSTNGAAAPRGNTAPSPVAGSKAPDDARSVTTQAGDGAGTTKARGLKRLIAAVRRL